ncbi:unnamed protein product [Alternaria sp. RS040]
MAKDNMRPNKVFPRTKGKQKTLRERRDVDIMNTNDSSIVSKRSVSKLYLSHEPDFYEPFVPKFLRRILAQLMQRKRDTMLSNGLLRDALLKTKLRHAEQPVYLRSDRYMALGCDLKDLVTLERLLRAELDVPSSSILFVAEVSVTYMPLNDSDALIRWASTIEDARFCILEQYLPQGPAHPFARTMLSHFDKLKASINAVKLHSSLSQQATRFRNAGWPTLIMARNLWDLWSDDAFTPPALRSGLDAIEPFDEWEEFALFGGHYFLLVASNAEQRRTPESIHSEAAATGECSKAIDAPSIALEIPELSTGTGAVTPRRFTAAFAVGKDSVAFHGGQGTRARLADMDVLRREDHNGDRISKPCDLLPTARMCHTITSMHNGEALLVGGRGSPTQACADCWLFVHGAWTKVDDLVPARYRHCAVAVTLGNGELQTHGVFVFGGKASDGTVLDAEHYCALWTANNGWHSIPVDGPRPSVRFGAAISTIGSAQDWGLLIGGANKSGVVVEDAVWEWSVSATPTLRLNFRHRTNDVRSSLENSACARIGANLVPWNDSLMLIGGVSKKHIHSLSDDFLLLKCKDTAIEVECVNMQVSPPTAWPLLVGVGAVSTSQGEIVLAGGGAVCFSMGSYWNEEPMTIFPGPSQGAKPWRRVVPSQVSGAAGTEGTAQASTAETTTRSQRGEAKARKRPATAARTTEITRVQIQSSDDFAKLTASLKPAIIEGLDIGPCTDLWTLDYLTEKLGPERELVIHECSSDRMTFKDKNFSYIKRSVSDFLGGIAQGSHAYLRAVSSSQPNKLPTKLEEDFPTISNDFRIPTLCNIVRENYHSSPLRISGPVTLWLHYDVLSNILCQIRGSKTLLLYPPTDVSLLGFPPGGSSSNIDVLTSKNPKLRRTHPHVASLKPGDILYIPPMWSHTATPEDGVSVAVNVFWKGLEKGYAAGKDVYGNRDLQAYENGRRDVEKIVKAFRDLPADVSKFYLARLADEILERSEKLGEKKRTSNSSKDEQ